jgi:hypothetical protein
MKPNTAADFWRKINVAGPVVDRMNTPCRVWTAARFTSGYGRFNWSNGSVYAHRFAWERINGPIPPGLDVLHRCDNRLCTFADPDPLVSHLFLGSPADNAADMVAKGRQARGERHVSRVHPERVPRGSRHGSRTKPDRLARGDCNGSRLHPERLARGEAQWSAKLTEADVTEIRRVYGAGGVRQVDLGARFGVSQAIVSKIVRGVLWRHVRAPCVDVNRSG